MTNGATIEKSPGTMSCRQAVAVTVRGQLVDTEAFRTREDAERYKQMVRRWALENRLIAQFWVISRSGAVRSQQIPIEPGMSIRLADGKSHERRQAK